MQGASGTQEGQCGSSGGVGVGVEECSELRLERQAGAGIDWALSFLPTPDP